jgi:hypothetical protein
MDVGNDTCEVLRVDVSEAAPQERSKGLQVRFLFPFLSALDVDSRPHSRLQGFQGRDVPLCYGLFTFVLPCAEEVVGIVLEDLTALRPLSLAEYIAREIAGQRLTRERADSLVRVSSPLPFSTERQVEANPFLAGFTRIPSSISATAHRSPQDLRQSPRPTPSSRLARNRQPDLRRTRFW